MKIFLILLSLINLIYAYDIQIASILGDNQFEKIKNATLNMIVENNGSRDIFSLNNNVMYPGSFHTSLIDNITYSFKEIESIKAFYQLNIESLDPIIYIKFMSVIYMDENRKIFKKIYHPTSNKEIQPNEEIVLIAQEKLSWPWY